MILCCFPYSVTVLRFEIRLYWGDGVVWGNYGMGHMWCPDACRRSDACRVSVRPPRAAVSRAGGDGAASCCDALAAAAAVLAAPSSPATERSQSGSARLDKCDTPTANGMTSADACMTMMLARYLFWKLFETVRRTSRCVHSARAARRALLSLG